MIPQQGRDVKIILKFSTKKPATAWYHAGSEKLISSFCEFGGKVLAVLFVVSKAGLFHISKTIISQYQSFVNYYFQDRSKKNSRELRGGPRGVISNLPRFALVCPSFSRFAAFNT